MKNYTKRCKQVSKSKYKYVHLTKDPDSGKLQWVAQIRTPTFNDGYSWYKECETEREAAIAVDKKLIGMGREPVNILKKNN